MTDNLIYVRRANVRLQVKESDKDYYLAHGYSVIEKSGKVIEEGEINDVATLKAENKKLKAENKELRAVIEAYKAEKADGADDDDKPKRSRKTTKSE